MSFHLNKFPLLVFFGPLLLAACASGTSAPSAVAELQPTRGSTTSGNVRFVQNAGMVRVTGDIRSLKPNSEHGFHVHETGDCSSGDGMSAGGHFNPDGKPHGNYTAATHHAGDIPSLKADANGVARFSFDSSTLSVGSGSNNITGKSLIVHRDPDDYLTQPTGNSGPRLACAVIKG